MKNIHLLPTDKPSRLYLTKEGFYFLLPNIKGNDVKFQHIYITSDEEIKDGWSYDRMMKSIGKRNNVYSSKIILTTDQDLIDDGVQAIDDEFLEWFVKNPSCEEVEVERGYLHFTGWVKSEEEAPKNLIRYKIIIPKEEPNIISNWLEQNRNPEIDKQVEDEAKKLQKQHLIDKMKQEPKQETLEEAAERIYPTTIDSFTDTGIDMGETKRLIFINGAKWQQERSYSEEDMAESFMACWTANVPEGFECKLSFNEWFEQSKKK